MLRTLDGTALRHAVRHAYDPSTGWVAKVEFEQAFSSEGGKRGHPGDGTVISAAGRRNVGRQWGKPETVGVDDGSRIPEIPLPPKAG